MGVLKSRKKLKAAISIFVNFQVFPFKMGLERASPVIVAMRNFLFGAPRMNNLRFQEGLAARPGPEANLPEGPSHKLNTNYYYTRDARREVEHPKVLADNLAVKQLPAEGSAAVPAASSNPGPKRPGVYWDYST